MTSSLVTNPFGGEAGNGVDASMWELRSSSAACLIARSLDRSYRWNSGLDFMDSLRLNIVDSFLLQGNFETVSEVRDGVIGGR